MMNEQLRATNRVIAFLITLFTIRRLVGRVNPILGARPYKVNSMRHKLLTVLEFIWKNDEDTVVGVFQGLLAADESTWRWRKRVKALLYKLDNCDDVVLNILRREARQSVADIRYAFAKSFLYFLPQNLINYGIDIAAHILEEIGTSLGALPLYAVRDLLFTQQDGIQFENFQLVISYVVKLANAVCLEEEQEREEETFVTTVCDTNE